MEVSGQLHASAALPPGKEPLNRRLGGFQSGVGKNSQPLSGLEHPITEVAALYGNSTISFT
jgi:hypothetical protein